MKTKSFLSFAISCIFFLFVTTNNASCKWDDKSDELPGMGDNNLTGLLVVSGVVITGLVVLVVVQSKKKKKIKESNSALNLGGLPVHEAFSTDNPYAVSLYEELESATAQSPVELFMACGDESRKTNLNISSDFSVGLRFKF